METRGQLDSFSVLHATVYSLIGVQTLYLATHFNPVYWNTACLIVNSGALEEDGASNYVKIAKAIGEMKSRGVDVSLIDINESDFDFKPDAANSRIYFGMKGLVNVGDEVIYSIIQNRPYVSFEDFYERVHPKSSSMVSLIKAGAFDKFEPREKIMEKFIWLNCDKKNNLTLQNLPALDKKGFLPQDTEEQVMARRVFHFNKYLKANCAHDKTKYKIDSRAENFLIELGQDSLIDEEEFVDVKQWDKVYKKWMDVFRTWIAANKENILARFNEDAFNEEWQKYAQGNISTWEMSALGFYYHEHELKDIDVFKYGIASFNRLPETPRVEKTIRRGDTEIPIYKLSKICGTVIAKEKNKRLVYLLTPDSGVVSIKFNREYFSNFDRQLTEPRPDGTKKVIEKSWFERGSLLIVQGFRRGDTFVPKKYQGKGHQLYKIEKILDNGELEIRHERVEQGV